MGGRTLVAGIGNIFLGDDGFGVEVVRRLAERPLAAHVTVRDVGIRGVHLAYELLDGTYERVIVVDAMPHGGAAGALVVVAPDTGARDAGEFATADAHGMHPAAVLDLVRTIGGALPDVVVVGCQPACLDEGIGLSPPVLAAVDDAVARVVELITSEEQERVSGHSGTTDRILG